MLEKFSKFVSASLMVYVDICVGFPSTTSIV